MNSSLTLKEGGTVRTTLASNTLTLGASGQARTEIDDTSISIFDGQSRRKRVPIDNTKLLSVVLLVLMYLLRVQMM